MPSATSLATCSRTDPVTEYEGRLMATGRIALVASRYHGRITSRLVDGALESCREAGFNADDIDVVHVAGAFELGVVVRQLAEAHRHVAIVAIGVVIRGDTPHFDFVAGETARALGDAAVNSGVPVGLGLLTCDTMEQATARAGGSAGNKGRDAADAAIRTAHLLQALGTR